MSPPFDARPDGAPEAPRRGPGGPGGLPATAARILTVARQLFAERGYEGTTIRDITTGAEANVAAVTYHFGSKEGLYADVLRSQVGPMARRVALACRAKRPPLDRVETVVRTIFDHIRTRPEMPRIMVREMASGREIHPFIVRTFRDLLPLVTGVIREGQRDGSIRDGDPVLLTLSMLAQPVYLNLARRVIAQVAGIEVQDEATAQRMADHACVVVRAALQRPATEPPGQGAAPRAPAAKSLRAGAGPKRGRR